MMSTRERKPRNNMDSPTPTSGSDSTPSTPTSKANNTTVKARGRGARGRSRAQDQNATDETESVQSNDEPAETTKTSNTRASRVNTPSKEESLEMDLKNDESKSDDPKEKVNNKARNSSARKRGASLTKTPSTENATKRIVRSNSDLSIVKKATLLKRKTLPITNSAVRPKKSSLALGRPVRKAAIAKKSDEENKTLRSGRPRNTDSPVTKRKKEITEKKIDQPKESESQEQTSLAEKITTASDQTVEPAAEVKEKVETTEEVKIKEEKTEFEKPLEVPKRQEILDKMAQNFNDAKVKEAEPAKTGIRRSVRQRKSQVKDKEEIKQSQLPEVKKEPTSQESVPTAEAEVGVPEPVSTESDSVSLHVDTASISEKEPVAETAAEINLVKAASLSPELVSEGVSEISVKTFYGEPAFLENNLGIEKDPKLGEIVQVHEMQKLDKIIPSPDDISETASTAPEKALLVPPLADSETKAVEAAETPVEDSSNQTTELATATTLDEPKSNETVDSDVLTETLRVEETPAEEQRNGLLSEEENKENNAAKVVVETNCAMETLKHEEPQVDAKPSSPPEPPVSETPELQREKEKHFLSLGLLSHQAAVEAEQKKMKRREMLRNGKVEKRHRSSQEYTGTLKTVIKLPRASPEKTRRTRMPLKMTFQKGKLKQSSDKDTNGSSGGTENIFYTIQQDNQNESQQVSEGSHTTQSRKAHNRSHNDIAPVTDTVEPAKETEKALVIPEKASSFKVHPDRLCQDQCFYCGGKFGLYDTPCHIAQLKSVERQDKILKSEEKLTRDSCMCDACFRHVDRKANCPSYKKRLSAAQQSNLPLGEHTQMAEVEADNHEEEEEADEKDERDFESSCCVRNCEAMVEHTLRKKWITKMKKQVSKIIDVDIDVINNALTLVPICDSHYQAITHLMVCAMCKKRLPKNHIYYIAQDISRLERLIFIQGIPLKLGHNALIVCKLCRYYANLLLKPSDDKPQKAQFVKNYSKRLLQAVTSSDLVPSSNSQGGDSKSVQLHSTPLPAKRGRKPKRTSPLSTNVDLTTEEPEVSIIPRSSFTNTSTPTAGHILLDNDVMVDYDTPLLEHYIPKSQKSSTKASQSVLLPKPAVELTKSTKQQSNKDMANDMTRALKSNPNISMRELFPGEEDLNLQIHIPFASTANRSPEGWARVHTTLQYDEPTRLLWDELQKPYGNQSSFLRHLILLEKYFRNGDLVLSQNASSNAVNYSTSVKNRLKSFDNVPSITSADSLNILQQLSNAPITIIPKSKPKTSSSESVVTTVAATSVLKSASSLLSSDGGIGSGSGSSSGSTANKRKYSTMEGKSPKQAHQTTPPAKLPKVDESTDGGTQKLTIPPDLISINSSTSTGSAQKLPGGITMLSPSKKSGSNSSFQQVIKLPDTLSATERKQTARPWRPTLIPITSGSAAAASSGPLYQTADGRKLPGLVQVMSLGKPYHISIHDYNRMCILRREKLLLMQQREQNVQKSTSSSPTASSSGVSAVQNSAAAKTATTTSSKSMVQIPNQILEQNSLIPLPPTVKSNGDPSGGMKAARNSSGSMAIAPKPPQLPSGTIVMMPPPPPQHQQQQIATSKVISNVEFRGNFSADPVAITLQPPTLLPNSITVSTAALGGTLIPFSTASPTTTSNSAIDALIKSQIQNNLWLWNEGMPTVTASSSAAATAAQNILLNSSGGSILVDNSVLSKIPKSLTVIPQQRGRSSKDASSGEENSSSS